MDSQWISLNAYASKYGVSVSTLRRRIKENGIGFKLEGGKYLVLDQPQETLKKAPTVDAEPTHPEIDFKMNQHDFIEDAASWQFAQKMIDELKAAYSKVLQEKEAQICQLKEEVVDLKMLVKVLEDQGAASKSQSNEFVFFDETYNKDTLDIER